MVYWSDIDSSVIFLFSGGAPMLPAEYYIGKNILSDWDLQSNVERLEFRTKATKLCEMAVIDTDLLQVIFSLESYFSNSKNRNLIREK